MKARIERTRWGSMKLIVGAEDVSCNLDFLRCVCSRDLVHEIEGLRPNESVEIMLRLESYNIAVDAGNKVKTLFAR